MRNNTPELVGAVTAPSIITAIAARLDFQSETLWVWTGVGSIQAPANSGDSLLDNQVFDAIDPDLVDIGENTFTMGGSNELTVTLNVSSAPPEAISAAMVLPAEFQSRSAVFWRAVKIDTGNPLAQPVWLFRRIRSGTMDKLSVQADGQSHRITLTIESHGGKVSNATNQTYQNQRSYDPNDSSQDSSTAIANGDPAPTKASTTSSYSGGGGTSRAAYNNRAALE
ncbi:hypothetical protein [Sphingomonas sp. Leaf242]|uniref:hypothetical protein n=1 Tax=Sphingomonas sp. Leaf242 TaxID=1736304 RepID=UPI0007136316|nr:hypothetical protein [Sphingomonas sp. Leaf242]KQO06900.1 hypothetical protein ASF09_11610 [Sphingomonas sp. Leaf242]